MIGIVFALLSTLAFGISPVLARKRLDESTFFSASFVITIIGNVIVWPLTIFVNFQKINLEAVVFFAAAGIISNVITRIIYFKGMAIVGVTINELIFSTVPIYSLVLAVLLLNEPLILENCIGTTCIIIGIILLERSSLKTKYGIDRSNKNGFFFPFLAAISLAFAIIFRKFGLSIYNEPILGVAIGYAISFPLYVLFYFLSSTPKSSSLSQDFRLFWKAGGCIVLGGILIYLALSFERVTIVSPLKQIGPFITVLLTYFYLKELKHISYILVISMIMIIFGGILVTIS